MRILHGLIVIALILCTIKAEGKAPAKPANVHPDATWSESANVSFWNYPESYSSPNSIAWYPNGIVKVLSYVSDVDSSRVVETYYSNGNLKYISRTIRINYLKEYSKEIKNGYSYIHIGPQIEYYDNSKIKEYKYYIPVIEKNNKIEEKLAGKEVAYDEAGNETKHVEHESASSITDEWPRYTVEKVIEKISNERKIKLIKNINKSPVVGSIISVGEKSREAVIEYNRGYSLAAGDWVCCLAGEDVITLECITISNGRGTFSAREDASGKFKLITLDSMPRFYKANEIRYTDLIKKNVAPKSGDTITIDGIPFVFIPSEERNASNSSQSRMPGFWMTKYEITVGEYLKFFYENNIRSRVRIWPLNPPENQTPLEFESRYPVNLGKYSDYSRDFCIWFSLKHGIDADLPTGQEWNYAARGGTKGRYYWGNDRIEKYCWYMKNSGGKLHPVGGKLPNAYGLYDIIGNAWEWCEQHTLRGGSCRSYENELQYQNYIYVNYEHADSVGDTNRYTYLNAQGTSFRMIIRIPEK